MNDYAQDYLGRNLYPYTAFPYGGLSSYYQNKVGFKARHFITYEEQERAILPDDLP